MEDETGVANLVIWPRLFEQQRRVVLGARMMGVDGQVQREGEVVHVVARRLYDLSGLLDGVGERDGAAPEHGTAGEPVRAGHADGGTGLQGVSPEPVSPKVRDIFIPDLSLEAIRVRPRDFR